MMTTIYEPAGRAGEYSKRACSLLHGCPFGCLYCYVPEFLHMDRARFHQDVRVRSSTRGGTVLDALSARARHYAHTRDRVLLSFTHDPYCYQALRSGVTRGALEIFREHGIPFQVLTKAGTDACCHFDLYRPGVDLFAVTLTCDSEPMEAHFEPRAGSYISRLLALAAAREHGIGTWASCEPVLNPESTLHLIKRAAPYCDLFKIGLLNPAKDSLELQALACAIDWRDFGRRAIDLCESLGVKYYIKHDLARHLKGIDYHNSDNRTVEATVPCGGLGPALKQQTSTRNTEGEVHAQRKSEAHRDGQKEFGFGT